MNKALFFTLCIFASSYLYGMEGKSPSEFAASQETMEEEAPNPQQQLFKAIEEGSVETVIQALQAGADVNSKDAKEYTPLMRALISDNKYVMAVLIQHGAQVNAQGPKDKTPLMFAAKYCDVPTIWFLLSLGAHIAACDNDGNSVFMHAVKGEKIDIVQYLLQCGADINVPNNAGFTPIQAALLRRYDDLVDLLLKAGAYPSSETSVPALVSALRYTALSPELLQNLIDFGADVNEKDQDGWTALMAAAIQGDKKTIQTLIKHGARVNDQDSEGFTALMVAVMEGHVNTVKLLLSLGADATLVSKKKLITHKGKLISKKGKTALEFLLSCQQKTTDTAMLQKYEAIKELLLKHWLF